MESQTTTEVSCKTSDDSFGASGKAGGNMLTLPCKRKHRWTASDNKALKQAIVAHGPDSWTKVAACVGTRTARQCKEHYHNVVECVYSTAS